MTHSDNKTSEVVARLQAALDKGPEPITTDLYGDRYFMGDFSSAQLSSAQDAFVTACSPAAIQTLLTALREQEERIERLRTALARVVDTDWAFLGRDADTGNPDSLYNRVRDGRKALGVN